MSHNQEQTYKPGSFEQFDESLSAFCHCEMLPFFLLKACSYSFQYLISFPDLFPFLTARWRC
jgi:hypothetical protein